MTSNRSDRQVELVDAFAADSPFSPDHGVGPARSGSALPRWSWLAFVATALVVVAVVAQSWSVHRAPPVPVRVTPPASIGVTTKPVLLTPVVVDVGHPLLAVNPGWDLFGFGVGSGTGVIVRVQLARGRITTTNLPERFPVTPSALIGLPGRVVVRPTTYGDGYTVPDGSAAARLTGRLVGAGPVVAGPRPGQVWVRTNPATQDATRMTLLGTNGRSTGVSVDVPGDGYLYGDGAGHIMYTTRVDGTSHLTAPGRWQFATAGQILSAGVNRVVAVERRSADRYATVVTDVGTGHRQVFAAHGFVADPLLAPIAPDGRTSAILDAGSGAASTLDLLDLLDLRTGAEHRLRIALAGDAESVAWSPDGRWLFAATDSGQIVAVDARTAVVHRLDVSLPPLTQLVVRSAPA